MSEIDSTHIGKVVSFDVRASGVLGTGTYRRVKVLGILDHESAMAYRNVASVHANVYPSLPTGTPDDHTSYLYVKVQFENGEKTVVGMPWIETGTLTIHDSQTLTVEIQQSGASDIPKLRRALVANGFDVFDIQVKD